MMIYIHMYLLGATVTLLGLMALSALSVAAGRNPMSTESEAKILLKLAAVWPATIIVIIGFALGRLINR